MEWPPATSVCGDADPVQPARRLARGPAITTPLGQIGRRQILSKTGGILLARKGERSETRQSRQSPHDETTAAPPDLGPEEGVRLMRAFVRIRRRSLREIVVNLAVDLADAEDEED